MSSLRRTCDCESMRVSLGIVAVDSANDVRDDCECDELDADADDDDEAGADASGERLRSSYMIELRWCAGSRQSGAA